MTRRQWGSGSYFRRGMDGRWMFSVTTPAGRIGASSTTFCGLLRRVQERGLAVATEPTSPRTVKLVIARTIATHTSQEWHAHIRSVDCVCEYCGRGCGSRVTKEHRTPLARGGSDGIDNLAVACPDCNGKKGTQTEAEFRAWMSANPEWLATVQRAPVGASPAMVRLGQLVRRADFLMSCGVPMVDAFAQAREGADEHASQ